MRYLKLFENFNDSLIKQIFPEDGDMLNKKISTKEGDLLNKVDIDLIYENVISKFLKRYNLKLISAKGYNVLSESEEDEYIDFVQNRLATFQWKVSYNQYIQVNKYEDDWWVLVIRGDKILKNINKFVNYAFFLCDTREALLEIFDWLEDNKFLSEGITESVSDYKVFENFNYDDLIKFLSNPQELTLIKNKEPDYITQSDLDLIYNNLISKLSSRFNFRLDKVRGYDDSSGWIDFEPNKFISINWYLKRYSFDVFDSISVYKYQDDWWVVIVDINWIFQESKKGNFSNIRIFLCDTRDALLNLYEWLIDNEFLIGESLSESISNYADGLMSQISANQFYEIEDEYEEETESLSQVDIDYLKSKMKSSDIPYSNWGLFTKDRPTGSQHCKIIFRLNRRIDYAQKLHYTSIKFEKYRDDFWLCEILSDNGNGDDYMAMIHIIIDSKEGLEEFFNWTQEPKRKDFFRIGNDFQVKESLNIYSRLESDTVKVFESSRDFDEWVIDKEIEEMKNSESKKIQELCDDFIDIYNKMYHSLRKSKIRFNKNTAEYDTFRVDRKDYDYGFAKIEINKFTDDWWIIKFHLPNLSSPEGEDTLYFLCDSRDGLNDSKLVLKNYLEQL